MMFRANAYTAQIPMKVLSTVLPEDTSVLSRTSTGSCTRVTWQCQTISLVATSEAMYTKHVLSIGELKTDNFECIQRIPKEILRVMTAFPPRLQRCNERHGDHLRGVIHKE